MYKGYRQASLALERPQITARLIPECQQTLTEAAGRNEAKVSWIKGHGNSQENRIAYRLDRKAPSFRYTGLELTLPARTDLIKEYSHQKFIALWDETTDCGISRKLLTYPEVESTRKYQVMNKQITQINGELS